jgi:ABC-type nitrate/sulfonate/bicarbonate transport system substrate-binding protein
MLEIKIGGVPEHFNYPWKSCIEQNAFQDINAFISWKDCHGGTGEMIHDLKTDNIQLAIMLTEGCINEIESGTPFKIVQKYVESPLIWGVYVNANTNFTSIEDLKGKTAAISRYNSGSHLMTYVLADSFNWDLNEISFKECGNLDGAFKSLENKTSDYLLWESFTTKPYIEDNNLRHIGNCPTPWPCFVIVCKDKFYETHTEIINNILKVINAKTSEIKSEPDLKTELVSRFNLSYKDVDSWLGLTEWSQQPLSQNVYNRILTKIKSYGIIS